MGGKKTEHALELNNGHVAWLNKMQENYGLFDADKALRIVLDYVMEEVDPAIIFEEVRCNRCSNANNQD